MYACVCVPYTIHTKNMHCGINKIIIIRKKHAAHKMSIFVNRIMLVVPIGMDNVVCLYKNVNEEKNKIERRQKERNRNRSQERKEEDRL